MNTRELHRSNYRLSEQSQELYYEFLLDNPPGTLLGYQDVAAEQGTPVTKDNYRDLFAYRSEGYLTAYNSSGDTARRPGYLKNFLLYDLDVKDNLRFLGIDPPELYNNPNWFETPRASEFITKLAKQSAPAFIVYTGGGLHFAYKIAKPVSSTVYSSVWEYYREQLEDQYPITLDPALKSINQKFRAPGTLNLKDCYSTPRPVTLLTYNSNPTTYDIPAHISGLDQDPVTPNCTQGKVPIPPCIRAAVQEGVTQGKRDNTAIRIACKSLEAGITESKILDALLSFAQTTHLHCETDIYQWGREKLKSARRGGYKFRCSDQILSSFCPYPNPALCPYVKRRYVSTSLYNLIRDGGWHKVRSLSAKLNVEDFQKLLDQLESQGKIEVKRRLARPYSYRVVRWTAKNKEVGA